MVLEYYGKINGNYKGTYHNGYTRITNDIRNCDRLSHSQYRLLEAIINGANGKKDGEVKFKKWKLEKSLGMEYRRINQLSKDLKKMGFISDFESMGGYNGEYIFTLNDNPHLNPYVILSEIEYSILDKCKPRTRADFFLAP